ncbi:hypothetical protein AOLI_G00025770 [Acnodon oligacanthus]
MMQASPLATPELFKAPRHQLPALPWPIITYSQSLSAFRQWPVVGPGGQWLVSGWPGLSSALMDEVAARPHGSTLAEAQGSLSERADGSWKACWQWGEKPQT